MCLLGTPVFKNNWDMQESEKQGECILSTACNSGAPRGKLIASVSQHTGEETLLRGPRRSDSSLSKSEDGSHGVAGGQSHAKPK